MVDRARQSDRFQPERTALALPHAARWRTLALAAVLAVALWLPRAAALDRLVTPDEPSWLVRSANFYQALASGDLARTFQHGHPGVTVMWAGMAGMLLRAPALLRALPGQFDPETGSVAFDRFAQQAGWNPLDLLVSGRAITAAWTVLALVLAYVCAARLIGSLPALLGFALIAADPFQIALGRLLHLDGLASALMLLAALAWLGYRNAGRRRRDLLAAGVAAGLACLTKSPALLLLPWLALLAIAEAWPLGRHDRTAARARLATLARPLAAGGLLALGVFVLLWPAMWGAPASTVLHVLRTDAVYAVRGHSSPLFFDGRVVLGDPGLAFYPLVYLWRATPPTLAGLLLAALALAQPRLGLVKPAERRMCLALLLFVLLFAAAMSLGAKKFDRYLLPIFAPLDLVAGIGWLAAIRLALASLQKARRGPRTRAAGRPGGAYRPSALPFALRPVPWMFAGLLLAAQLACALPGYPYYLGWYNPLLGGAARAPRVMMVGWGEGLDQVAGYLNRQDGAANLRVASGAWYGSLSYFLAGEQIAPEQWRAADYVVLYVNELQRGELPADLLRYANSHAPELVVRIKEIEYARIYRLGASSNTPAPADATGHGGG